MTLPNRAYVDSDSLYKVELTWPPKPHWQFPFDRFVEYKSEDEEWARGLDFGRETTITKTHVFPNVILRSVKQIEWQIKEDRPIVKFSFETIDGGYGDRPWKM